MSANERTGWRDKNISLRHRLWGLSLSATDIDFVLVETKGVKPVAIFEYKNEHAQTIYIESNYQCLVYRNLGNSANLPAFLVKYSSDFQWFKVQPLNVLATKFVKRRVTMTELEYIRLLYDIRGENVPDEVLKSIVSKERTVCETQFEKGDQQ